jgi:hypothetical protein
MSTAEERRTHAEKTTTRADDHDLMAEHLLSLLDTNTGERYEK